MGTGRCDGGPRTVRQRTVRQRTVRRRTVRLRTVGLRTVWRNFTKRVDGTAESHNTHINTITIDGAELDTLIMLHQSHYAS